MKDFIKLWTGLVFLMPDLWNEGWLAAIIFAVMSFFGWNDEAK